MNDLPDQPSDAPQRPHIAAALNDGEVRQIMDGATTELAALVRLAQKTCADAGLSVKDGGADVAFRVLLEQLLIANRDRVRETSGEMLTAIHERMDAMAAEQSGDEVELTVAEGSTQERKAA